MGKFYGLKIRAGERTIEDVPHFWLDDVNKWLQENPLPDENVLDKQE